MLTTLLGVPDGGTDRSPAGLVLVVEDDPQLRAAISWALEDEDLPHVCLPDGAAAVAWLEEHRPAAVLLDMGLPLVDGFGVAAALRRVHGADVPVVVMTAGSRAAESAQRTGARDFLAKPFEIDDLLATVRRALNGD